MAEKKLNMRNLVTLVSVTILVGVELFGVAIAAGWALAGLFELGDIVGYALMLIFSGLAGYLLMKFVRAAAPHERLYS